jgi:agmatinase
MSDKLDPVHGDRLNLPFTGIATFAKVPYRPDLDTLDADVAIVGAPYDMGTQVRSGARYGPRGIRNASAIYGMRSVKYYDSEFDEVYLDGVTIVDVATPT